MSSFVLSPVDVCGKELSHDVVFASALAKVGYKAKKRRSKDTDGRPLKMKSKRWQASKAETTKQDRTEKRKTAGFMAPRGDAFFFSRFLI
jgi:hypothetical protein